MSQASTDPTASLVEVRGVMDANRPITLGSGFLVAEDTIATARHVVRNKSDEEKIPIEHIAIVRYADGMEEQVRSVVEIIEGQDERDDIALIKFGTPFEEINVAKIDNVLSIQPSEVAFAGFPIGDAVETATIGRGEAAPGTVPISGARYHWLPIDTEESRPGLSGGPVVCLKSGVTVGLITEHRIPDTQFDPKQKCWAINAGRLRDYPFDIPYEITSDDETPKLNEAISFEQLVATPAVPLENLYALDKFVGRAELLDMLTEFWSDTGRTSKSVFYLYGLPWVGKSLTIAEFRRRLSQENLEAPAQLEIEHDFDEEWPVEALFDKLRTLLPSRLNGLSNRALVDTFQVFLRENRVLFSVNALEKHQKNSLEEAGEVTDPDLQYFIDAFSEAESSKLFLTSRTRPKRFQAPESKWLSYELQGFSKKAAEALYKNFNDNEPPQEWISLCKEFDFHPGGLSTILAKMKASPELGLSWALDLARKTSKEDPIEALSGLLEDSFEALSSEERTVMLALSQFSGDVQVAQLQSVIEEEDFETSDGLFVGISRNLTPQLLDRLRELMLLSDAEFEELHVHRFVKRYFDIKFKGLFEDKQKRIHKRIATSYRSNFHVVENPTSIAQMLPGLETVAHLCKAGEYGTAARFLDFDVQGPDKEYKLSNKLGAVSAFWRTLLHFFPDEDLSQAIMLGDGPEKNSILHSVGYCQSVLGASPKQAQKILRDCAKGMIEHASGDEASEVFRSAAYSAVSAAELKAANEILNEASEVPQLGPVEEFKILLQKTVTEHMRGDREWREHYDELKRQLNSDYQNDLEHVVPRNSLFVVFLARIGRLNDFSDIVDRLKNYAQSQGWREIVARMYSIASVTSGDATLRRERSEQALGLVEEIDRIDLAAEILVRQGRFLLGEGRWEPAKIHLEMISEKLPADHYPLLSLDYEISLAAAASALGENVDWEDLSGKCRFRSYDWGLKDIERFKADQGSRLV